MVDDEPTGGVATSLSIAIGASASGTIEVEGDIDYYAVDLKAGVTYQFDLEGARTGSGTLDDPLFEGLFDANNKRLVDQDDDGGVRSNSRIVFTPETNGTYYLAATSFNNTGAISIEQDDIGTYTLYVAEEAKSLRPDPVNPVLVPKAGNNFIDAIASGATVGGQAVGIVYAPSDDGITRVTYSIPDEDSIFLIPFHSGELDLTQSFRPVAATTEAAFETALATVSAFTKLEFERVPDEGTQFGVLRLAGNAAFVGGTLGIGGFPSEHLTGGDIIVFEQRLDNESHTSWVVAHELGHTLGLSHIRNIDDAVENRFEIPDKFFGVEYTQMTPTFESAFFPGAVSVSFYPTGFGYFDILALRHLYGADNAAIKGDNVYSFDLGREYFQTIFDTGGNDTIEITGTGSSVEIDLTPDSDFLGGRFINIGTTITYYGAGGSSLGTRTHTVFVTPETVIENITAAGGDDIIVGNNAINRLIGGAGSDVVKGMGGNDNIFGDTGNDTLEGGDGDDFLSGGLGDDIAAGGRGNDKIFAGSGDTGDDIFIGGDGDDIIGGNAGNDLIIGDGFKSGASDFLKIASDGSAAEGRDTLFGADGDDTVIGGGWTDGVISDNGIIEKEELVLSGTKADVLWAGAGNDLVYGAAGADVIGARDGRDTVYGGGGDDTIFGGSSEDADLIFGGSGNDVLFSGAGDDTVNGDKGDDTLYDGSGSDTYSGGEGIDTFVFSGAGGDDRIRDFDVANDILDLTAISGITSVADIQALAVTVTGGITLALTAGTSLLLEGVTTEELSVINILT